ncbi:MAG: ABC transporter ATP-binding protein [Tenericutes bacterium]|nr:ABC transporter ATP-binding protein [Mycoplasmatota bacterium]
MSNIVVKEVSKSFDDAEVLHDINLEFKEGHIYGFVGRNGSGKSVLFKILCGLYFPTTGSVVIDGVDIHKNNIFPNNMRVFIEKPNFLPNLTGLENLKLLASIQNKITEDDIIDILNKLNLKDDMNKLYHKYSLGMKQKLAIAQVLMEDPEIMIFDEPFNGIEEKTVKIIKNILLEEKKKKKIILIASHIKDDIEQLADIVYLMDDGKIKLSKNKK